MCLYFEGVHIETTDNIDFYSESAVYINYKVYGTGIASYNDTNISSNEVKKKKKLKKNFKDKLLFYSHYLPKSK